MAYKRRALQGVNFRMLATGILLTAAAIMGPAAAPDAGAGSNAVNHRRGDPEGISPQAAVVVGSEAPDITLESVDGDSLSLSALQGDKNVILVFFRGTW